MTNHVVKHDCQGCQSFPECPCGDGTCPPHCSLVSRPAYTDPGLVTWPVHDPTYHDDGQSGLYAWLVVPTPEAYEMGPMRANGGCCVDVWPTLCRPDAPVSDVSEFWEPYDWRWNHDEGQVLSRVEDHPQLRQWVQHQTDSRNQSDAFYATIFLGATSCAYYSEFTGQFEVKLEHLTDVGRQLYDALAASYNATPVILTFLDT